jgi:hypothetical protein
VRDTRFGMGIRTPHKWPRGGDQSVTGDDRGGFAVRCENSGHSKTKAVPGLLSGRGFLG